jgi:ATP-binding cassette, subfamily B, multidrug efflux pump
MKKVFSYLKFYWWQIPLIFGLVFSQTLLELELPDYMSRIINEGILTKDIGLIIEIGTQMLLIALAVTALAIAGEFYFRSNRRKLIQPTKKRFIR